MGWRGIFIFLVFLPTTGQSFALRFDPAFPTAEYYFSNGEYSTALPLWRELAKKHPNSLQATLRVAEITLATENRDSALAVIDEFSRSWSSALSADDVLLLRNRRSEMCGRFMSEQGQSHFLRAQRAFTRKDYDQTSHFLDAIPPEDLKNCHVVGARESLRLAKLSEPQRETAK